MTAESENIDAIAWRELDTAAQDPHAGFRYVNVCTLDAELKPQARMMVLRRTDSVKRRLEFHTDIRSAKWQELALNPAATVLGFCSQSRLQLRLQGYFKRYEPESALANQVWEGLPIWTRRSYSGGPPGDESLFSPDQTRDVESEENRGDGKHNFGVLVFQAESLDWFQLQRNDNRRARLIYSDTGCLSSFHWINP
ncbi:pyridoxamine 5'-phosphate oxidase [Pantoea rodasii]|uniref:Pyridoxamine 5'-phosphate oxidase n=1 Tax=Pantoea rodasii TaxID=1076549 RepID=A0A2M9WEF0_9GAMM|nr:pyridoxamine 5'-phosphate oxidase family protein [Pantoea rodasii]ORM57811.1 pyridoxamine 5'-phosphate oxidase [Pantoea rodasii]PJZ05922.1 pyridoxamine 5'-phosphate oxidase [Pantoea rodasii]